jgi:hypothetical protein
LEQEVPGTDLPDSAAAFPDLTGTALRRLTPRRLLNSPYRTRKHAVPIECPQITS